VGESDLSQAFAREDRDPDSEHATGWTDIDWTVPQLEVLLACKFENAMNTIDTGLILEDGMTPGDAVSHVKAELARRL
jgi:hypothetical protein